MWLDAFWELSTNRQAGFASPGQIPSLAVDAYCERLVPPADHHLFKLVMRMADAAFLQAIKEDGEKPSSLLFADDEDEIPQETAPENSARDAFRASLRAAFNKKQDKGAP